MKKSITLNNYTISEDSYPYIIAEAGINHNGDFSIAKELILKAKECGANAIKFQKRNISKTFTSDLLNQPYNKPYSFGYTYGEHKSKLEFTDDQYIELCHYANELNIDFLCSGFDITAFDFIDTYVSMHKIPSPFINHHPLLEHIARFGKPIILSTGMHSMDEIEKALNVITPINDNIILMQCTTSYPIEDNEANLNVLNEFKEKFNVLVGYSSHDNGIIIPSASVLYGACVIEKHFTLDKNMVGPDHIASIEPKELMQLRINCNRIHDSIGGKDKLPNRKELEARKKYGVSWTTSKSIKIGEVFTKDNICIKCPGFGISPLENIYGKRAKIDIDADTTIIRDFVS